MKGKNTINQIAILLVSTLCFVWNFNYDGSAFWIGLTFIAIACVQLTVVYRIKQYYNQQKKEATSKYYELSEKSNEINQSNIRMQNNTLSLLSELDAKQTKIELKVRDLQKFYLANNPLLEILEGKRGRISTQLKKELSQYITSTQNQLAFMLVGSSCEHLEKLPSSIDLDIQTYEYKGSSIVLLNSHGSNTIQALDLNQYPQKVFEIPEEDLLQLKRTTKEKLKLSFILSKD